MPLYCVYLSHPEERRISHEDPSSVGPPQDGNISLLLFTFHSILPPYDQPLFSADPEIAKLLELELERERTGLEMIPSENFVSPAVLAALGSVATNKYAEGYPGKRYYGGCTYIDGMEQLAIDRAKQLFGAEHVNVQPHSGAPANIAVYTALLQPGDTVLGMDLSHGGHLTHGHPVTDSAKRYNFVRYVTTPEGTIDYDNLHAMAWSISRS